MRRLPFVLALLLCACAAAPAAVRSEEPHAGHAPGTDGSGTPHPSVPEGADGLIEVEDDFAFGGDGVTVAEALEVASSQPVLITAFLLRDASGRIWVCDAIAESDPPLCGSPRAIVTNWPSDATVFAPENASSTGARTEGGVTWIPDQQVFGVAHPSD